MQQLAGPASTFSFSGTFGIIIGAGTLLGWAEYQRRLGLQYRLLVAAPLLIAIIPAIGTGQLDGGPIGLVLGAMVAGYSVSGRGPLGARIVAAVIGFAGVPVTFFAPRPSPDLSFTTPHGAWFCTLASSLFVTLALASSIPMLRPGIPGNASAAHGTSPGRGRQPG